MGMGWKNAHGGEYTRRKCKCGKGEVITYVNDHEESDYPPFTRGDEYWDVLRCPNNCEEAKDKSF